MKAALRDVAYGSWLRENSEIEYANGNFVSTSINLKNKSAGDGCRDKTIEKTILRAFRARTFSRSQGQNRKSSMRAHVFRCSPNNGHRQDPSACPFRAKLRHPPTPTSMMCYPARAKSEACISQ